MKWIINILCIFASETQTLNIKTMKKVFLSFAIAAVAAVTMASCGNKSTQNTDGQDSTAVAEETPQISPMGSWDFPEGSAIANAEEISVVLFPNSWKSDIDEGKDPATDTHIYYNCDFVKAGDVQSTIKHFSDEYEIPNSLIIPFYKGATAKKGDIVLTWWQSGSGMQRAIVVDAANPAEPKVHYLDLSFKGDGTGFAEKHDNETLKPNSFIVVKNGEWMSGVEVVITEGTEENLGVIINVADDKVLYRGFAGKVKVAKKSDCRLLPLNPGVAAGQTVKAEFVGKLRPDYKVKKVDAVKGRVWVERDGNEEVKSFLEVSK